MIDLATTQRRTLTVDECAELLGVSRRSIYNWFPVVSGRVTIELVRERLAELTPPALSDSLHRLHSKSA